MKKLTPEQIELLHDNKHAVECAVDNWSSDPELTEAVLTALEMAKANEAISNKDKMILRHVKNGWIVFDGQLFNPEFSMIIDRPTPPKESEA